MSDLFSLSTRADRRMTKLKSILICLFFISTSSSVVLADSIQGCGGFVEASSYLIKSRKPSDSKLDYSHITVELRTVDGLVKDSTQCAPNGYYFIPVYDKGSFVIKIKGPEGWSWDPDKVPVVIDHNGCNANADINFRFTGFTLSGRVVGAVGGESCSSKDGGPSNVKVELLSVTDDLVSSTFTSAAGSYLFTNVLPGQYKLRASHPSLKIEVKGSSEVELGFGNGVVDDIFFVPGYDIQGSVVAQGNPILGVHIYLYSDDVLEVNCPQGFSNSPREKAALCHAVSDGDGKFTFNSIPCGSYELLPYYKGENTVFDVSPPSMSVALEHRHVTVAQKFQVTGFSVGGRVIDGYGVGVDGVKIIVDGQERSSTDSQGRYKLDQVTSKHYTIVAKKDHYKFDNLENFLVLPNMASVVDIKAVYYDVCGVVHTVSSGSRAKVALTHGPENVKPQVKQTDESGRFCFEVPSGEYRLSALAATQESFPELVFLPAYVDVKVNSPLFNVEFSQAQVDIRGSVLCKEKCGPSVFISLISSSSTKKVEKKTVSLLEESTDFVFPKVFPGKYRLEVKHKSSSGANEDIWCWERNSIDVDVGTEDINEIVFVQKGYWIDIISTHDVDAYINQPDASVLSLQIKKGNQRICLESPGPHELHFVNSCIFFGSSSVKFDTSNLLPIYLKGEKYLLRGQIHVDSSLPHIEDELANNINVDVLNSAGEVIGSGTSLLPNGDDQKGTIVYEYSVWANLGDVLTFVPRDSRNTEGKKILFYPREHHVSVTSDGCQATIPAFSGRLGLYMEGSVSPPLSGVEIRIISAGESKYVPIKKGELVLRTTTDSDGTFVAGPLYDDTDYRVEASKAGYHLKRVGPNSFSCQKLSQISVHIHSGDATEPFPSVLLSLSGEDNYRNNSASGVGGFFLFDNLFPGTFYLRPLLKEYSFSPSAQAIELGSGESKEVAFRATRVAYSAMGSVSLLSGQPVEGLSVEARSESGYFEETTTDSAGHYRLRGLLPDTSYLVKVVAKEELGSTKIERASPEHVEVKVGTEDIKGLDFVVFEQPEMTILSGHVEGTDLEELQSHLLVEVKSANDPSKIKSVLQLPLSNFFQIKNLPKSKYLIQLRYNARSSILKFESEIVEVDLEKQAQAHVGPLKYSVKEDFQKQELTTAPVFPLVAGVFVIFLFISMPRLNDLYQTSIAATGSATSVKKETRKPVVRKKTY